jgi:2-polyprenyl-3-methyl-5-hydroxy-6-metoxy-1,4-benzoquinol methylase
VPRLPRLLSRVSPATGRSSDAEAHVGGLASGRLRDARYQQVLPYVRGAVLELGCGTSPLPSEHRQLFTSYTGSDVDSELMQRLAAEHPEHRYGAVDLDHEDIPSEWGTFDTILVAAVIEHLFNLELVMRRLSAALSPAGRIVMTTPTPFGNDVVLPLTARLGITSADAFTDHINILNKRRFELLASEVGLELVHYRRFQLGMNSLAVIARP